ncbi:Myrosinase 1 [Eumeta japonica]|uniref:beta-glucosidase n=1 Tax=Eumeta variegata TaxID=151549 RepID=A0A4C1SUN8_EUMVA|nr:Myrosinase 1 [Eumeta japonica]
MFVRVVNVLLLICALSWGAEIRKTRNDVRNFPDGFLFGTATASYQVEGAWDEDGKSENIWDHMTHTQPCIIKDCSNGDVADDSYHQYERDVEMMRELGLDFYRFSLSWSRILPSGFADKVNEAGVAYYNNLINEMLKYNIEPMITLYHWDLPQRLQDLGGWANPHIVDWFSDYARVAYEQFGDRVKYWITINEPREVCYQVAHAKAYHIYDEEFKPVNGGVIGITLSANWYEPETDSESDTTATEERIQFEWGQYAHPIYSVSGDFPPVMKEKIAAKSEEQGYPRSRLPEFTPEEIESMVPWGFYKLLTKIRESYNNPPVFITENGFSTTGGLEDDNRIRYYRGYLSAMLDAMEEGSDVRAYAAWSLMDNFEWMQGYTERFGLYEVDYESPERTRTPRKSAFVYKEILRTRTLDPNYEPDTDVMTIDEGH